jgi:DeoR/GlpR family transcriptional regulator of sugar metabolism
MEYFKTNPEATINDFYLLCKGVGPKTIQRDLHELVARNAVKKAGDKRWAVYTLNI